MTDPETRKVAHHEAGHSVMAVCLGYPISLATIVPAGDAAGRIEYSLDEWERQALEAGDESAVLRRVMMALSGLAGDYLHIQRFSIVGEPWQGHWGDKMAALEALKLVGYAEGSTALKLVYRDLQLAAAFILSRPDRTAAVHSVADALVERLSLTGDEVHSLCKDAQMIGSADDVMLQEILCRTAE